MKQTTVKNCEKNKMVLGKTGNWLKLCTEIEINTHKSTSKKFRVVKN